MQRIGVVRQSGFLAFILGRRLARSPRPRRVRRAHRARSPAGTATAALARSASAAFSRNRRNPFSPARPTHSGQSCAQPSRSIRVARRMGGRTTGSRTQRETACQPSTGVQLPIGDQLRESDPVEDLGEDGHPVDDPRARPAEVRRSVDSEDLAAADGVDLVPERRPRSRGPFPDRLVEWKPQGIATSISGSTSPDRVPRRLDRSLALASEQLPATGTTDLFRHPVACRERRRRAIRARRRAAAWPSARRSWTRRSISPSRVRRSSSTSTASSSASVMAPTVEIVLKIPSMLVGSSDTTVMSPPIRRTASFDLPIAHRADVAQLLGEDQVRIAPPPARPRRARTATSRRGLSPSRAGGSGRPTRPPDRACCGSGRGCRRPPAASRTRG